MQYTWLHIICLCAALQFQLIVGKSDWYNYTGLSNDQLKSVINLVEGFLKDNNNNRGQKAAISHPWINLSGLSNAHYNSVIALADSYKSENNNSKGEQGNVDSTRADSNATETWTQNSSNPEQISRPVNGQTTPPNHQSKPGTHVTHDDQGGQKDVDSTSNGGNGEQKHGNSNAHNPSAQQYGQSVAQQYGQSATETVPANNEGRNDHIGGQRNLNPTTPKPTRHICTISTEHYDCQIQNVHLKKDQPNSIVFGLERNNNTQQKLTFRESILEYLPKSLIDTFRNVTLLNLNEVRISLIEPHAFEHAADLQTVYLADNRLVRIGEGAFHGANNLQVLVLSNNEIVNIDDSSFDHNSDLRYFYLDRNQLTTLPSLTNTVNLEYLNASRNNLESIEDGHFQKLKNLQTLDLSFNQLKRLDLQHLHAFLDKVDVSSNNLTELVLPLKVKHLNANNNLLKEFKVQQQCKLESLLLAKNRLDAVPELNFCKSLNMLDLSYNLLEVFNFPATMSNLEYLRLKHNNLFEINLPAFTPKGTEFSLKLLNLSHNKLSYGPHLREFKKLHWVLLNDNNLIKLRSYADQSHNKFKFYHMANNEWSCEEIAKFQKYTTDKNKDLCAANMPNITGICCKVYNKPFNDLLNQILRDADFSERQNQKKCPKTEPATNDQIDVLKNIRNAISRSDAARVEKLKEIEQTKMNETNIQRLLEKLKQDRYRVNNSKHKVTQEIEKQRQTHRVAKEGLISDKDMLKRIIKFVQEKDAFTTNLLLRRRQDTEDANNLWENKKQEINAMNQIITTLQEQLAFLKTEQPIKKREKDLLEKQLNKNAPNIHGSTGRRT